MTSEPSPLPDAVADVVVNRRPVTAFSLADRAFHEIAKQILGGDLGQGARIREAELIADLRMSRTPIREALQRLELIGLVEALPSRFTVVTAVSEETAAATREFAALYVGSIARLAAQRLDDAAREQAIALAEAAVVGVTSSELRLPTLVGLFGFLADNASNELLRSLLGDSWYVVLRNLKAHPLPEREQQARADALQRLVSALRSADADEAESAARATFGMI